MLLAVQIYVRMISVVAAAIKRTALAIAAIDHRSILAIQATFPTTTIKPDRRISTIAAARRRRTRAPASAAPNVDEASQ